MSKSREDLLDSLNKELGVERNKRDLWNTGISLEVGKVYESFSRYQYYICDYNPETKHYFGICIYNRWGSVADMCKGPHESIFTKNGLIIWTTPLNIKNSLYKEVDKPAPFRIKKTSDTLECEIIAI